jgi:hypothetical protein
MTNWARSGFMGFYDFITDSGISATAANTKSSWSSLTTGLDTDIHCIIIHHYSFTYNADFLIDIGIGSTPDVIVNNVMSHHGNGDTRASDPIEIPIFIPKDTQIQARQQNSYSGTNSFGAAWSFIRSCSWNRRSFDKVYTYGANTSDSGGQLIDPGGTANTDGSWVELISAAPQNLKAFKMFFGARGDWSISANTHWWYDVGVGASGSEVVIVDDFHVGGEAGITVPYPKCSPLFEMNIPEGERLAVRSKCTVTTADRYKDVLILAFA